jgi:N-methylhydantoinase A
MLPNPMIRIGIDTGGTFTDIVAVDGASGAVDVTKVARTPHNPAIGLSRGVREILARAGAVPGQVSAVAHGTTVATNALLQGDITGLGLIVTATSSRSPASRSPTAMATPTFG